VLYNTSVVTASSATYGSNYPSLMSSGQQQQQLFNNTYTALILEEAEKLYNELTTELTSRAIAATAASIRSTSLPSPSENITARMTDNK
jgi:hypothetical protein